jgi:hypothetical protein
VDSLLKQVLRDLEKATKFAESYRFELTDDYVALIERVEALPQNRPGAEKHGRPTQRTGLVAPPKASRNLRP